MRAILLSLSLLIALIASPASAASSVYHLTIGSSRYLKPAKTGDYGFLRLDGARNGATSLSERLSAGGARFGISLSSPEGSVVGLADADKALGDILARITADKTANPLLVVYIAAHGISDGFGWDHFSVPGDLTYRGPPDKLPPDLLAEKALYTGALVDRLTKAKVHYLLILDTCYEGTPSVFQSPVLTPTASQNIGDIARAFRFKNEFHQDDPVLFSTTPGTTVPVAPDPTDPTANSMGPLARRLVMQIDAAVSAHRLLTVADIVRSLRSAAADPLTRPAVTFAKPSPWWSAPVIVPGAIPGHIEERSGTATKPRVCCIRPPSEKTPKSAKLVGTITLIGSPSEFVSDGQTITLRSGMTIERPDERTITLRAADPKGDWQLDFTSPGPWYTGIYANADRAGFASDASPGLSVSGRGHGCNEVRGTFELKRLPTASGVLEILFKQFCDDIAAPLRGEIKVQLP